MLHGGLIGLNGSMEKEGAVDYIYLTNIAAIQNRN
jgi:hypothetical protein